MVMLIKQSLMFKTLDLKIAWTILYILQIPQAYRFCVYLRIPEKVIWKIYCRAKGYGGRKVNQHYQFYQFFRIEVSNNVTHLLLKESSDKGQGWPILFKRMKLYDFAKIKIKIHWELVNPEFKHFYDLKVLAKIKSNKNWWCLLNKVGSTVFFLGRRSECIGGKFFT